MVRGKEVLVCKFSEKELIHKEIKFSWSHSGTFKLRYKIIEIMWIAMAGLIFNLQKTTRVGKHVKPTLYHGLTQIPLSYKFPYLLLQGKFLRKFIFNIKQFSNVSSF